ncbi:hypothetical protein ACOMCU_16280 [Lysinibacillus sp. UGB7]|uniref:hypothetical protein n=1 Tax=Lysinibacillus sp. UGB7 TaxID=3411039 RepID=UPI003B7DBE95
MNKEDFLELVRALDERESSQLLSYLSGYYAKNEEFISVVLDGIEVIEKYKDN